jgi:hypothetical protein
VAMTTQMADGHGSGGVEVGVSAAPTTMT